MSDEEIEELITQIVNNFGISCDDASYIVKSFENFGKEFMMSEADKMFEELGYKKKKLDFIFSRFWEEWENEELVKTFSFNYRYEILDITDKNEYGVTMQELQAINEKCKELGWLDE